MDSPHSSIDDDACGIREMRDCQSNMGDVSAVEYTWSASGKEVWLQVKRTGSFLHSASRSGACNSSTGLLIEGL